MSTHEIAEGLAAALVGNPTTTRKTALEFVRETLRQAILDGGLPGGARLVQSSIADALSVSTTPVREALRDLASEGLVIMDVHRGAVVRSVDYDEVRDIYDLRAVLEPLSMRRTAEHITAEQLARLSELQDQMDATTDVTQWVGLNNLFHNILAEAAQWPLLTTFMKSLQDKAMMYVGASISMDPAVLRRGGKEHRQIIQALRKGDVDAAAAVAEAHLRATSKSLLDNRGK